MVLACCHECVIDRIVNGVTNYQGPSPDEITLVDAANRLGVKYLGKDQTHMNLSVVDEIQKVEFLQLFEFNSDRKRMSAIIRDNKGIIKLYIKGADGIIKKRLGP
jgi:magnesium-transporting ATPase (P-type)